MGFAAGSISFTRFAIVGEHPKEIDQEILDKLGELTLETGEYGVPEDVEYGWCGGRHILDRHFTFEHNVYADALHFAIRIDTNRVPSELKHAYQAIEEEAPRFGDKEKELLESDVRINARGLAHAAQAIRKGRALR